MKVFKELIDVAIILVKTNNYALEYLEMYSNGTDEQILKEQITKALDAAVNVGLDDRVIRNYDSYIFDVISMLAKTNSYALEYLKRYPNGTDEQFLKEQITKALDAAESIGFNTV